MVLMLNKASFLHLFLLFLGFSYAFSAIYAVPATRSLKSIEQPSSVLVHGNSHPLEGALRVMEVEEGYTATSSEARRVAMENTYDYPGTGANNHHDPKTPATKP